MNKQNMNVLSKTEYGIYFDYMNNPSSIAYNIPFFLKLSKNVDIAQLKQAVKASIDNHSYIKSRITVGDDGVIYKFMSDEPAQVEVKQLQDSEFDKKSLVHPFDLLGERLYRCCIFDLDSYVMLFFDVHHIIFDGFSAEVFMNDIDRAYNGLPLESELITANDFSNEEAERLKTDELDRAKEYYNSVFGDCELDSVMINDKNDGKPAAKALRYEFDSFNADEIRKYCRKIGIKTSAFFCGVYGYLLARFSGADESLFSTVYNGRNEKLVRTCGMFVKTLPVYCDFKKSKSVAEFLKELDKQLDCNRKYDLYSYADICSDLQISPSTIFAYQGDMFSNVNLCGEDIFVDIIDAPDAKSNVTAEVSRNHGKFSMKFEYRSDLYEESSIINFLKSFEKAVTDFIDKDNIDDIDITDDEQLKLLDSFTNTEKDYEKTDIVTLFRRQAEQNPNNAAVVYLDKSYTYKEVDEISEKIGAYIKSLGIGKEDVVSVLIPRCEYMVFASLGVSKSGAAYQPLDPSYPQERLEFMMSDADAKLLIAGKDLLKLVPNYKGKVLFIEDISNLAECDKITANPNPKDKFIMLYTSGSTGTPKGCMLEHRNLVSFCNWYKNYYNLTNASRVAAYASYGFDANMMDMYPALTTGACVYIIDESIRLDLLALDEYFDKNGITHSFMTTQVGRQFALETKCKSLQHLSVGGEKLVPIKPQNDFCFYNVYGPTECTIFTTAFPVHKNFDRVPIGKALDNTKLYVVDKYGRRVPPCVPGELWVAGHGVSRGYLNRPEQNEKTYIKNPFTDAQGYERVYRTGDIVRFLPDGNIDFIGRNDGQVKIRGFRIELSEVERIIREFPDIKDATVAAFDEPSGGKFIAAYIVSDKQIDIDKLNDFIIANKPPYMVPAVTMQIDKIPLNQNQKVNKRALPVPEKKTENIQMPENEVQQRIFDCISEVTGSNSFGINTDIFYAGVTSIGAIKLNVLLSKEFDTVIKINDLKENSTILKLEKFLSNAQKSENFEILADYPITQTQNGIFVECAANPDSTIYNIPYLFKLSDKVDTDRLKTAVENTINAHPYLKTKLFINDNSDIRALRNDEDAPMVDIVECSQLPDASQLVLPYKILDSNLYRAKIFRTADSNYLFLDFHHIICDGTSEAVIIEDINGFYEGKAVETESYTGFEAALDEEKSRKTDAYTKAKEYYDSIFSGCDSDFLPAKDKNEPLPSVGKCEIESDLSVESVKEYCDKNNITLNAFFNGVFGLVLSKYNYKDEALYTTIYNGRSDSRLSRSVTMLVKTLPVHCNTDGEIKIVDLLSEMKDRLMQSMSNDIYSFAEISRAYDIKADIMFVYQGDSFEFDSIGGEIAENIPLTLNAAKAPISINVFIRNNKFVFVSDYRSDMYSENVIQGISQCIGTAAEEFLNKTYLKEVSILSDKSKEILNSFNDTEVPIEQTTCNKLFERQVAANPDKTAVIANKISLTYQQLNENANRIAHSLIDFGVKPDDMVGVMMPRTVYAYAARQGVLKAGGAFMPLDPKYPDDRISYILEDSKSKIIVTTTQTANERKALFEKCGVAVLTLEEMLKSDKIDNPDITVSPSNLCYCIYTSGSTGKPKGVMIEHHSLVNFVDYNRINVQSCEFCDNMSVSLALAALTFDVSVLEESLPLYHGTTIAMANEDEINNPILLAQMLVENKVDVMKCTPSYMNNMLDVSQVVKALKNMKAIDIGAEAFPAPLYDKMRKAGITAKIHNGYGPTEATITTSMDVVESNVITIGKPLCNTKVYILDKHRNILPPYVPGELTVLGECVGRGYVGKEELTKDKFITFENLPAYRSGDLAFWGYDGKIHFMGRMDNQVKLRGLRVELDEIENVMNDYPAVLRSVVLVKENPQAGQFLCGYFTASESVDKESLTKHMKRSLTHYMIPSVLIQLDSLPLTNNGKIDKKALPEPEFTVEKKDYIAPKNDLQKKLCDMFAGALGTDKVGINENFFEIGGTSLSASKIAMKAMTENLPVAYGDIFDNPTVEMLERHILNQNNKQTHTKENQPEIVIDEENKALRYNTAQFVDEVIYTDIENVLLTGSTGFLGIHVLMQIIEHTDSAVYCLVRHSETVDVEQRLKRMLVYYFSDSMDDLFGTRIFLIEGDITDKDTISSLEKYDFKTVINCAACVKHFTNDDTLERINVNGVENLISFCVKTGKRLVQISTVSVAGININGKFPREKVLYENELFFGQDLSNKYIDTKFRAEKALLEAVANDNLDGKIIRVGNLMSRHSDGEFQINSVTNGFMRNLRAYAAIGKFPVSLMDDIVEFSPIDVTAAAVMCLAGTNSKFTVYHACNGHKVEMGDVIAALNSCGIKIDVVKDSEFNSALKDALKDDKKNMLVSGLISYLSSDSEKSEAYIGYNNSFTNKALYRLGFKWPITNETYLKNAFEALDTLGYFEGRFE